MADYATLYPIYWLADASFFDDEPFDCSVLPFEIIKDVAIEDVTPLLADRRDFELFRGMLANQDLEALQNVRYGLVHRFRANVPADERVFRESEWLVRNLAACLRLVRPMRQGASLMRGEICKDGTFDVNHFEHPVGLLEVPEVQKLFKLRNHDARMLRGVAGVFLRAMREECWKFRMAVEFHEAGHFQDRYWKSRYLLWCSAAEAIFTSNHHEHRGSLVAKERIKWFLGADTPIYEHGDIPSNLTQSRITVSDIVDDMYRVRNFIAHGDRIPGIYRERVLRIGLNGNLDVLRVLPEAVSFIVRKSLLRILQKNWLEHFADAMASEAFFASVGLTLSKLKSRPGP